MFIFFVNNRYISDIDNNPIKNGLFGIAAIRMSRNEDVIYFFDNYFIGTPNMYP